MPYAYVDFTNDVLSEDIDILFPNWQNEQETLCVISPHDDDALIGAGYAIRAAQDHGAQVCVIIVCRGDAGYSQASMKDAIVDIRRQETLEAYGRLGITEENILRLEYHDFSAFSYMGWRRIDGSKGDFEPMLTFLRRQQVSRLMIPNHYREHIDHLASHMMGSYNAAQAGDAVVVDIASPHPIRTVLEYAVWSEFGPEDMLEHARDHGLRANRAILISGDVEDQIARALTAYRSQDAIIEGLVTARSERRLRDGRLMELYIQLDPRPKLNFEPYRQWLEKKILNRRYPC